jgi:hypothetical protein
MFKIIVAASAIDLMAGCSSSPKVQAKTEQFCDMKSKTVSIRKDGQVVDEKTVEVMECNDNRIQRLFQVQSGMAPNCGEFSYWMQIGGKHVQRKGVSCQKLDGTWEVVNTAQY